MRSVKVGEMTIGPDGPLTIIAGPCLAESKEICLGIGQRLRDQCEGLALNYVFKASFDKANRSSIRSPRGQGVDEGLRILEDVRAALGVPVTTDIHEPEQAGLAAEVVDLLQIPAFLCRQSDLLGAASKTGKPVNIKKGQFLSPSEMAVVVDKLLVGARGGEAGEEAAGVLLTERGTFFGYQRLVNDFIGLGDLMELGWPVCFDVTHSTQLPGAGTRSEATVSAGRPERAPLLARAAVAAGVQAVFMEAHPDPGRALSDGATMLPLNQVIGLLAQLRVLREVLEQESAIG